MPGDDNAAEKCLKREMRVACMVSQDCLWAPSTRKAQMNSGIT